MRVLLQLPAARGRQAFLLTHNDVETLFHEFGHALHSIADPRASYARFAGTNVPRDFVEAPSQMLQDWVWDKKVLDTFAADYRDPSKKIPAEIDRENERRETRQRRRLSIGGNSPSPRSTSPCTTRIRKISRTIAWRISNPILEKVFLPVDPSTTWSLTFGHLNGYDAGYYGYAWADAIAADMATVFEKSKDGYLDKQAGMRLRSEIYEVGDSRDVSLSVEKFLGRKQSVEPFLKQIGIGKADKEGVRRSRPETVR